MKCQKCGANLGLEDKYCPYCGTANPFAKQHQEEMQHFRAEFEKTKANVENKANRFAGTAVPLTILAIAFVLMIASFIFRLSADGIGRNIKIRRLASRKEELRTMIEEALDRGDYGLVDTYNHELDLYYITSSYGKDQALKDYQLIFQACGDYEAACSTLCDFGTQRSYRFSADRIEDTCKYLAGSVHEVYAAEEKNWYDESCRTEEKLTRIREIQEQMTVLLIAYGGFTREEIETIPDLSEGKLQDILIEKFSTEEDGDAA